MLWLILESAALVLSRCLVVARLPAHNEFFPTTRRHSRLEEGQNMLFQSRTAQVTIFQGDDEMPGVKAGHGGYDFTISVKPGHVVVRFVNTTPDAVIASCDGSDKNVTVAPSGTHDFDVAVPSGIEAHINWGTRSALLRFVV